MAMRHDPRRSGAARKLRQLTMPPVFRPSRQRDALEQTLHVGHATTSADAARPLPMASPTAPSPVVPLPDLDAPELRAPDLRVPDLRALDVFAADPLDALPLAAPSMDMQPIAVPPQDAAGCTAVEKRHVAEGFIVEIRSAEPEPTCADEDLRARHYLACVMPSPGAADVPGVQVANDMVFVPAGHPCQRRSPKSRGRHLCLLLQSDFVAALLPGDVVIRPLAPRTDLVSDKLRHLLDGIAAELEAPGFASDVLIQALGLAAVIELGRCLVSSAHRIGATITAEQRVVDLVRSHLQSGLDQPVSLDTLAAECGIGVRHLSRIFRKATGTTIGHCLAVARIEHAKRLLCGTSVMIKEISWRCGFREQAAFTTAFRRATGQSPSAFRCAPRAMAMPVQ